MNTTRRVSGIVVVLLTHLACSGSEYGTVAPESGGGPPGAVQVGSGVQYTSRHNGTTNPAVDTVAVGDTVTWQWAGAMSHGVRWLDAPGQVGSPVHTGSGTFTTVFDVPGTYHYDCSVHGRAMTGTIVVTGPPTTSVVDPVGDTFGSAGQQWDLTAFTITHDSAGIVVRLDFSEPVRWPAFGDKSSIVGLLEFDLDQNPATGRPAGSDVLRVDGGSAGLGVDGGIALGPYDADTAVVVFDANGHETLRVKPRFEGSRITIRVPLTALGHDDGLLNAVVAIGNGFGVTDIAPQSGHLTVGR